MVTGDPAASPTAGGSRRWAKSKKALRKVGSGSGSAKRKAITAQSASQTSPFLTHPAAAVDSRNGFMD
ncbi:MAG: hypothetical protein Kow00114_37690 [Kiloniellaceae bacterium]